MTNFANLPAGIYPASLRGTRIAIFGASEATPYNPSLPSHSTNAPSALRAASAKFAGQLRQYDFDLDAVPRRPEGANDGKVDYGDVPTDPTDAAGNRQRIAAATRAILEAGAAPIVLGGDDSVPIPWLAGFEGHGSYTVLQVDAHVDWGDVIQGNPFGYGSPMRRASQMPWVTGMVQIGACGPGSGGAWQIEDVRRWGSRLFSMRDLRRDGIASAIAAVPHGSRVLISVDCDGLDPAVLPAANMPTPGGLSYQDIMELLEGAADKAHIAGLALVELVPERDDPHQLSALTAARLVAVTLGSIDRGSQSGRRQE
jgi:agmatinase